MHKSSTFYIELLGIWPENRGSELMARAVIQKVRATFPNAKFFTRVKTSEEALKKLDIEAVQDTEKNLRELLVSLLCRLSCKSTRKAAFIFDISGFAYGDFWGSKKAHKRLGCHLDKWRAKNIPVFILPQAFGPFTCPQFSDVLKPSLDYASVVCPRDQQSSGYLQEFFSIHANVCPDITFSFDDYIEADTRTADYCVFVPNSKMIASQQTSRVEYVAVFRKWIRMAGESNINPILLCHEGIDDLELCREMAMDSGCEIIGPTNALEIKGVLRNALCVVTSRYHALISSITFSVPVIAYGWTHKYGEVMKEFDMEDMLLVDDKEQDPMELFRQILDPKVRDSMRARISRSLPRVRDQVDSMWQSVISKMLQT